MSKIEIPVFDTTGEIIDYRTLSETSQRKCSSTLSNAIVMHHFAQAAHTPFVNGIFGKYLHPFEQKMFSEFIFEGTIDLKKYEVSSSIKRCIKEMRYALGEMVRIL